MELSPLKLKDAARSQSSCHLGFAARVRDAKADPSSTSSAEPQPAAAPARVSTRITLFKLSPTIEGEALVFTGAILSEAAPRLVLNHWHSPGRARATSV